MKKVLKIRCQNTLWNNAQFFPWSVYRRHGCPRMVLQAYCWVLCITSEEFPYVMQLYAMVIHTTHTTELCCIYLYGDILLIVFFIDWSVQMTQLLLEVFLMGQQWWHLQLLLYIHQLMTIDTKGLTTVDAKGLITWLQVQKAHNIKFHPQCTLTKQVNTLIEAHSPMTIKDVLHVAQLRQYSEVGHTPKIAAGRKTKGTVTPFLLLLPTTLPFIQDQRGWQGQLRQFMGFHQSFKKHCLLNTSSQCVGRWLMVRVKCSEE